MTPVELYTLARANCSTDTELAALAGVSRSTVFKFKSGEVKRPDIRIIARFARVAIHE
jgi:transcriptional regulator with XRE-family HTH domain